MSEKKGSISIREKKRQRAGYSLIAPACLVLLVIFFVPLCYAFAISISDSDAVISSSFKFVGLKNYISVMTNSKFLAALGHTCFFVATTIILEFIIGFVVALLLYREGPGSRVFRLIFAVPLMVAPVVSGTEYLFGGTSIKRESGKELSIDCTLEITEGTAKVFWISGSDEAVTLIEATGTYSDTITLPDGGNYIGIECENFTGNIELNIE